MCQALEELYWEVHGERIMREQREAVEKEVEKEVKKVVEEAVAEKDAYIKQLEAQLGIVSA